MKYRVHTHEDVHGVYLVEASSAVEAEQLLEADPRHTGEQERYEAFTVEVRTEATELVEG